MNVYCLLFLVYTILFTAPLTWAMDHEVVIPPAKRRKIDQHQTIPALTALTARVLIKNVKLQNLPQHLVGLPEAAQNHTLNEFNSYDLLPLLPHDRENRVQQYLSTRQTIQLPSAINSLSEDALNHLATITTNVQRLTLPPLAISPTTQYRPFDHHVFRNFVQRLPTVRALIVPNNRLTSIEAVTIAQYLKLLEELDISRNPIDGDGIAALCVLNNLESLTIAHTESDFWRQLWEDGDEPSMGYDHLSLLKHLKKLNISGNIVGSYYIARNTEKLSTIPNLKELILKDTLLHDLNSLKALLSNTILSSLRILDISYNKITHPMVIFILNNAPLLEVLIIKNQFKKKSSTTSRNAVLEENSFHGNSDPKINKRTLQTLESWKSKNQQRAYFIDGNDIEDDIPEDVTLPINPSTNNPETAPPASGDQQTTYTSVLPSNFIQSFPELNNNILATFNGHILLHLLTTLARDITLNYLATATKISFPHSLHLTAWRLIDQLPNLAPNLQVLEITRMADPDQNAPFTENQFINLIQRLPQLRSLIIPSNNLTPRAAVAIGHYLPDLERLDISNNPTNNADNCFNGQDAAALCTLKNLRELIMVKTQKYDEGTPSGYEHLMLLTKLRKLDISQNVVGSEGTTYIAGYLSQIPHLEELIMQDTWLQDKEIIRALLKEPLASTLKKLDLRKNQLTNDMIMLILERAVNLERLDIRDRDLEHCEDKSPLSDTTKQALALWKSKKPTREYFIDEENSNPEEYKEYVENNYTVPDSPNFLLD